MAETEGCKSSETAEVPEGGYKQCPHGMCLNHHPEWVSTGKVLCLEVPFGSVVHNVWYEAGCSAIPFTAKCCGNIMKRFVEASERHCNKCKRVNYDVHKYTLKCMCCGYSKTAAEGSNYRFKPIATGGSLMAMLEPEKIMPTPMPGPHKEEITKKKKWWQFSS
jgi:hypothetical protein